MPVTNRVFNITRHLNNDLFCYFDLDEQTYLKMQNSEASKTCGICKERITDKKSYRQVKSSEEFCRIFLELNLKENNFVCKFCVNKLNRLVRIDDDIRNKLEKLHEKRNELIN